MNKPVDIKPPSGKLGILTPGIEQYFQPSLRE